LKKAEKSDSELQKIIEKQNEFSPLNQEKKFGLRVSKEMGAKDYKHGIKFWEKQSADYKGVLDGHIECHDEDIIFSSSVLNRFLRHLPH
jgi:hypothetical protein